MEYDVSPVEYVDSEVVNDLEPVAENKVLLDWVQSLLPVRKLPTNVGTRIRKCVYDSLGNSPPEWAREILEHSISKEVYKSNASGPTKVNIIHYLFASLSC